MLSRFFLKTATLLTIPVAMLIVSCDPALIGSGAILTENRDVQDFTGLHISVPGDVSVTRSDTFGVQIQAEENLLPYLETERKGNELHIYFSRNVRDVDGLRITISMPKLKNVQLSGSADMATHGTFSGGTLNLGVSGSGSLMLDDMQFPYIAANVSGSGEIGLRGQTEELDIHVSGSGEVDALHCPAKVGEVHLSGSGSVWLTASDLLKAHISGSGNVWYEGNPMLDTHISGSGRVRKL